MPKVDVIETGKKIMELRKKAGLSIRTLQAVFGFQSPQAIYKWERGKTIPTIDHLLILSDIYHVTIEDILVIRHEEKPTIEL